MSAMALIGGALVAASVLAVGVIALAAVVTDGFRNKNQPRIAVGAIRITGPDDLAAMWDDPGIPFAAKLAASSYAHQAGLCDCQPYDQDTTLTEGDMDWLISQDGA